MKIDESITELEQARDSIEPYLFIDETMDQSMKTAIEVMHKYQKIEKIYKRFQIDGGYFHHMVRLVDALREVLEDEDDD